MEIDRIETKDDAVRVIAEMGKTIKTLRDRGDETRGALEKMTDDVRSMRQQLAEAKTAAQVASVGAESSVSKYLIGPREIRNMHASQAREAAVGLGKSDDSKAILLKGFYDKKTATYRPGLMDDTLTPTEDLSAWQRDFQKAVTDHNLVYATTLASEDGVRTEISRAKLASLWDRAPREIKNAEGYERISKIFADSTGIGAEWVIDLGLPEVERDPRLIGGLEALMRTKDMAAQSELLPFLSTNYRPFKHVAGSTNDPAQHEISTVDTAQRTLSATGMTLRVQVDMDAAEDAIISALPFIQGELPMALAWAYEDCLINGDTAATHQDTGIAAWNPRGIWEQNSPVGGTTDHRRTFIGWRARATDVSNTTDISSTETYAGMVSTLAKLDAPHGGRQAIFVTSLEWLLVKMLTFSEFQGTDKVGTLNTLLVGDFSIVAGRRFFISDFVDKEYNASGVYDDTTKTKTGLVTVNPDRFWVTRRMGNVLRVADDITRSTHEIVIRNRKGLFTPDSSTKKNVHWGYNLSTS